MELSKAHTIFPKKSLAGSSFTHMSQDLAKVCKDLEQARVALVAASPHPRDYICDESAYAKARETHIEHLNALNLMIDFYTLKRDHCFEQA